MSPESDLPDCCTSGLGDCENYPCNLTGPDGDAITETQRSSHEIPENALGVSGAGRDEMAKKTNLRDYSVTLTDASTRTAEVSINADSIREAMAYGSSLEGARHDVEQNAFQNAIARGEIAADCWIAAQ